MPSYEISLVLKTLSKPETAAVLKRAALNILDRNCVLFGIENLGTRRLPYVIKTHSVKYTEGSYFLLKYDGSPTVLDDIMDEFKRDVDIIRAGFANADPIPPFECTLEEELKPAAYRKDVVQLLEPGLRKDRKSRYNPQIGLPYDPWK